MTQSNSQMYTGEDFEKFFLEVLQELEDSPGDVVYYLNDAEVRELMSEAFAAYYGDRDGLDESMRSTLHYAARVVAEREWPLVERARIYEANAD